HFPPVFEVAQALIQFRETTWRNVSASRKLLEVFEYTNSIIPPTSQSIQPADASTPKWKWRDGYCFFEGFNGFRSSAFGLKAVSQVRIGRRVSRRICNGFPSSANDLVVSARKVEHKGYIGRCRL